MEAAIATINPVIDGYLAIESYINHVSFSVVCDCSNRMLSDLTQGQEYEISTSYSFKQTNEVQHCCQGEAVKSLTFFSFLIPQLKNNFHLQMCNFS